MHLIYVFLWIGFCIIAGMGIGLLRGNPYIGGPLSAVFSAIYLYIFCFDIAALVFAIIFVVLAIVFGKKIWRIWKKKTPRKKHPKAWISISATVAVSVIVILFTASNLAVSALLVPAFMNKLEAFKRITEESNNELIQTDDIIENHNKAVEETNKWLETVAYELETVETEDGYSLNGVVLYPESQSHTWVLLAHGYTGWKEEMYPFAYRYCMMGYNCLVPDCRASGTSEGDYIGMGYSDSRDMLKWIDLILEKDPQAKVILHGQSMGGATVLLMAGMDLPDCVVAVVADCAYSDAYRMFQIKGSEWLGVSSIPDWMLEFVCLTFTMRGGYDFHQASPIKTIENSKLPILFIHGDMDKMVPVEMASELYDAAPGEKEILIVHGAGHAQSQDKDPDTYYATIENFLDKYINE